MTPMENQRLEDLEVKLDNVESKLDQVLVALRGSELTMGIGMVQEMKDLKSRVTKLENIKTKVIYMSLGAGIAGGFSISKIIEWIQEAAK